ncbi:MAG: SM-20-related protein [Paraglaciecola sp.]|jgi:SM-20-related protein
MNLFGINMTLIIKNAHLEESLIDDIADTVTKQGFMQLQSFLPELLADQLMQEAKHLASIAFTPAGIGRNNSQQINSQVRTDSTLWLNGRSAPQRAYLDWMEQLRIGLNRRLFMGLFDFECHFSHYSKGDFYQRHMDTFKGGTKQVRSTRVLSTVFYLNPDWVKKDGGELLLYADEQVSPLLIVPPVFNGCVIFISDAFPHEVLTSRCDRYSIAGWYRVNGHSEQHLDPHR